MITTITNHRFSVVDAVLLFGLAGSGFFTLTLFLDIYGWETFLGWFTGIMALGLFEFGAYGWRIGFIEAHGNRQRFIAGVGMFICSALSVASTVMQIIMSSKLWEPSWDEGVWTIAILAAAFAMNVIGGQLWELWSPKVGETIARQQLRDAKELADVQESLEKLQFGLDMANEQRRIDLARARLAYQRSFDTQRKRLDNESGQDDEATAPTGNALTDLAEALRGMGFAPTTKGAAYPAESATNASTVNDPDAYDGDAPTPKARRRAQ